MTLEDRIATLEGRLTHLESSIIAVRAGATFDPPSKPEPERWSPEDIAFDGMFITITSSRGRRKNFSFTKLWKEDPSISLVLLIVAGEMIAEVLRDAARANPDRWLPQEDAK